MYTTSFFQRIFSDAMFSFWRATVFTRMYGISEESRVVESRDHETYSHALRTMLLKSISRFISKLIWKNFIERCLNFQHLRAQGLDRCRRHPLRLSYRSDLWQPILIYHRFFVSYWNSVYFMDWFLGESIMVVQEEHTTHPMQKIYIYIYMCTHIYV